MKQLPNITSLMLVLCLLIAIIALAFDGREPTCVGYDVTEWTRGELRIGKCDEEDRRPQTAVNPAVLVPGLQ